MYDIIAKEDLARLNQTHSAIYKFFSQCYKQEFGNQERIVLYTSGRPSQEFINHIQQAAVTADISNFFIVVQCPFDISIELELAQKLTTDTRIKNEIVPVVADTLLPDNFIHDSSAICPLPWMHLEIDNLGRYRACCLYQGEFGTVNNDSLSTIFSGKHINKLRQELLVGTKVKECNICWNVEHHGAESNRQRLLEFYKKDFYTTFLDNPVLTSLDISPGNVCNFSCRICDAVASSKIAEEVLSAEPDFDDRLMIRENIIKQGQWFDKSDFVNQLIDILPTITNLDIYGGEPFLLKKLPSVLRSAIEQDVSTHIRIHFNTNGSIFPNNLIPLLSKFKEVDVALSIDNVNGRFEIERGGVWKDVRENLIRWASLSLPFKPYIFTTVNIQNVFYLDELYHEAAQLKLPVVLNFLHKPTYLNIDSMTNDAKQLVFEKYQFDANPDFVKIAQRVINSPGSDGLKFIEYMTMLDSRRKQNFNLSHNAIANAMGYL